MQDARGESIIYIRIYEVEIGDATDVSTMTSLDGQGWTPVSKRLLIDLNEAGVHPVDNIEALSWGRCRPTEVGPWSSRRTTPLIQATR